MATPVAWLLDDDLMTLGREVPGLAAYGEARTLALAGRTVAILAATPPLVAAMARFHSRVIPWPCLFDPELAGPMSVRRQTFHIGAFGGAFRREAFSTLVAPAIGQFARRRAVRLYRTADLAADLAVQQTCVDFEPRFARFIGLWRDFGLNAVVHPPGVSRNMANKGVGSLLVARYVGAPPIVGADPAYEGLGEDHGVLVADGSAEAWRDALERLADTAFAASLFDRLDRWLRDAFNPETGRVGFDRLAKLTSPAPTEGAALARRTLKGFAAAAARRWEG
jgi:hypothetical protein